MRVWSSTHSRSVVDSAHDREHDTEHRRACAPVRLALSGALIENDQEHRPSKGEAHGDNQTEVQDEADQGEAEG